MTVVINLNDDGNLEQKLDEILYHQRLILEQLARINWKVSDVMGNLDELQAEVENNSEVDASAIALLNGLSAQLAQIAHDPAAVQALSEQLSASSSALAAAVTANTPAAVEAPSADEPPVDQPPVEAPQADVPPVEVSPGVFTDAPPADAAPVEESTPVQTSPVDDTTPPETPAA
jgi:hypothetical protein